MTSYYPIVIDPNADPQNPEYSVLREIPANSTLNLTSVDVTTANITSANLTIQNLNINGFISQRAETTTGTVNLANTGYFKITMDSSKTVTITNPPSSNVAMSFVLEVNNQGSYSIAWDASIVWDGNTPPTIPPTSISIFTFMSSNGGVTWRGNMVMNTLT